MLFHGISGGHIQGIMEEMERRSKTEARLAKGAQLNGRDAPGTPAPSVKPSRLPGRWRDICLRLAEQGEELGGGTSRFLDSGAGVSPARIRSSEGKLGASAF
ncbi:hypothetical protein P7K49_035607 [Saguinus oedipus]|uniref:LIM/homeobox protein Lhx9 n=1 Tax=Saguinus oedipus TaxID=9490 RepID=A0ABQ9TPP9_SAGOE|nr:hypothetical protein P7K49_035607 [Saguinus oedipus]